MQYVKGSVQIRITGQSYDRFLNLCANRNLCLRDLTCDGNSYLATISLKEFRSLRPLARKSRTRVRIVRREGLPFFLYRYRHRKMLFCGMAFGIFLMFFLSFFIWDIRIEGNQAQTADVIFDFLKESRVYFGTLKNRVDCKELAVSMRRRFDNFTWVSVRIQGTQLLIDVQENNSTLTETEENLPVSDLVAEVDGVIESIITRKGVPAVEPGTEVKKGDLLVSGQIEIIGDDLEVVGYQYCAADADIRIRTVYSYYDSFSMVHEEKVYTGQEKKSCVLYLGNLRIALPAETISYETFDTLTEEYPLKLSGNFYLPVSLQVFRGREYQIQEKNYTIEEAKILARERFLKKLEKIQEKGVQIFQNNVRIDADAKTCVTAGKLIVIQDAGKRVERTIES
ncbi:MAG: sporulation protein YqfD [Candidatus Limivivens sp.]|nr:sporulation protein YqfD [Candidatus Limivivens sp.]